jgi:hypothetical protein
MELQPAKNQTRIRQHNVMHNFQSPELLNAHSVRICDIELARHPKAQASINILHPSCTSKVGGRKIPCLCWNLSVHGGWVERYHVCAKADSPDIGLQPAKNQTRIRQHNFIHNLQSPERLNAHSLRICDIKLARDPKAQASIDIELARDPISHRNCTSKVGIDLLSQQGAKASAEHQRNL